ncbi:MAG: T9SS type A sorting domain-containing protein [Ignavibacteria bacterium]|nr:T9SS type A sorting domain-containing protein [Ignavibacteria bacterium]
MIVYNISNPANPVEVGHYDTYPGTNSTAYQGCWNVYPYLPSGKLIASDIATGLYVIKLGNQTSVGESSESVEDFNLSQNYPNPFNPLTVITYYVPRSSKVKLTVTDALGKQVAVLVNEVLNKGSYSAEFKADGLSSGTYFYRIESGDFVLTKKMTLIK